MENKWQKIYKLELDEISKDKYDKYFPTEIELCKKYEVARNTIRKTILNLRNEGFIFKDILSNRYRTIKSSTANRLFSIKEENPNIESKIKYIQISKYNEMGTCLKYFKEKYLNGELHSFEECYVKRDILPQKILSNKDKIEESIFGFIEENKLETISFSKRRIYVKNLGSKCYVFNILDVYNSYNELIMHFNTISDVKNLDVSYIEYR